MSKPLKFISKNRYAILGGWLAIEIVGTIAAFPAMANLSERIILDAKQTVIVSPISTQPGMAEYLVSSNSAFAVVSTGQLGEYAVSVSTLGENSQNVGDVVSCSATLTDAPTRIYNGRRKTAARRGSVESQSIHVTISYDPELEPAFEIVPMNRAPAMLAAPCTFKRA
ncbi:restriction endonuclease subunit S domain-containing protein [Robiginitomaculum antarcticum]|uniref:hypothetical protein n=1 Tax=Robiginitomaculum antarcticum TaxID=437507 RepID=UPI00037ABD47|nr:hypothetical protein [Robiginitomaculum antarcticum]